MKTLQIKAQIIGLIISLHGLSAFNGYSQNLDLLTPIEVIQIDNKEIRLIDNLTLTIEPDKEWISHILTFRVDTITVFIDSVDLAADGFKYRLFRTKKQNEWILIFEAIYEYISYYPVYLIDNNKNTIFIGNLNIRLDCDSCDALNYPIDDIVVKGNDELIEFSFNKDLVVLNGKDSFSRKKDDIKFFYKYMDNRLIMK